jgi:hypothetical protein
VFLRLNKAYDNQKDPKFACDDKVKASPLFEFAKVLVQDCIGCGEQCCGSEGQYALVTADGPKPIYVGKLLSPGFMVTGGTRIVVFDTNGQCSAKVQPGSPTPLFDTRWNEIEYDIAAGVDPYAIIALATCLIPSTDTGATAGDAFETW